MRGGLVRSRSAFILGVQQLLGREQADPRVAQYLFGIPVLVDVGFLLWGPDEPGGLSRDYAIGLVIAASATVLALAISRGGLPTSWTVAIPMLDILATGFLRSSADSSAAILVVIPAIWLGLQYGRRGIVFTVLAVLASDLVVVLLNDHDIAYDQMVQQVLQAGLSAVIVALTAEAWQTKVAEAGEAQRMLERAVADSAEQRRFNEAILNSVDVGLLALDSHGRVHSMNPRHQRFLEMAYPGGHEGLPDRSGFTYGPDGFTQLAAEELPTWRAMHGEMLRDYLIWVGADPLARRAFAVSASPFFTPEGEFDGAVLAYHDVTELMTAARLKDEFVATVSHELRTPLTSIVGYVDILLEDMQNIPPEARPFLETVQRNARRLHRLVDDLLSDALKLGRAELHLGRISLSAVVRASAVDAEKAARAAGLNLETDISHATLEVHGDSERLAQVFDNLFNNAIKFTPAGGLVRGVVRREGHEAVVEISDTGRGIPPEELEDVFVKFFRSPGVQVDAIPGTGLGLAISKTIVEAHGGSIDVSSTVGVGTTLIIRLPLAGPRVARPA
jgi:two-component system phosphate regulon sensor histidine kinase PhoR